MEAAKQLLEQKKVLEEIKLKEKDEIKIHIPKLQVGNIEMIEKILEDSDILKMEREVGVSLTSLITLRIS